MRKLWGGAFEGTTDELVERFGQSLATDLTFWREDVLGSIAHARMLGAQGILPAGEAEQLVAGLQQILDEGPSRLPQDVEDIHTAVEVRLGEIVGVVAGKLHTARSRNDQVATDGRLWLRNAIDRLAPRIKGLQQTLLTAAEAHADDLMPGYTHQQRAQPITLGYHLLAHFWALQRHGWRLANLREVTNLCPLGSAALAGSGFPIDRHFTCGALEFDAPIPNALDATSDRSYLLDAHHVLANLMIDLSRISQELVLWSGSEFGFVKLADHLTTGSSIMPQKRNPDMAELIRGKTGRIVSHWVQLATTMKGLPLGYNRDTQEDKPPLFEGFATVGDSVELVARMIEGATWQTERMRRTIDGDFSTATDLADALAASGMPFRQAHEVVGRVVRGCQTRGIGLEGLTEVLLEEIAPEVPGEMLAFLTPEGSVRRRESFGGPGPQAVRIQLSRARELLGKDDFAELA